MSELIDYNSRIHDLIAPVYEGRHAEIFNETEQARLRETLRFALGCVRSAAGEPRVLDFGAGTGNLTRHLLDLGARVVACDVSAGCLRQLERSAGAAGRLETSLLNGRDLSQFPDASFDLVAVYSVLHHVPDYLAAVDEIARVVKPGGVICIDHEVCPAYWEERPDYRRYCAEVFKEQAREREGAWRYFLRIMRRRDRWRYLAAVLYLRLKRVPEDEGDIHTHPDDHIEWDRIRSRLEPGCQLFREEDYLVCRERSVSPRAWQAWREKVADMRVLVARRL